uniref:CARD domain-containing protein n=1 Tax=Macrostomum lignano TaxID=282301 RepID=A0A1I8IPJ3_9PLAT
MAVALLVEVLVAEEEAIVVVVFVAKSNVRRDIVVMESSPDDSALWDIFKGPANVVCREFSGLSHEQKYCLNQVIFVPEPFQLRHSVRVVEGCGLTDGEHCERINALLRPYGPQLKEMRLDRRTFFLAYVIRHLNATQLLNTDWLNCRLRLHKKHSDALSTELKELLVSVPQASDVAVLIELGKQFLSEDRLASNRPASALERLRSYATESQFLLRKMRTAYGQRDCQLIVRRLEKLRIKIRRSIGSLPPTQRAPMKDFLDPEGEVFISCGQSQSGLDCLLRKRIIDASSRSDRLKEEGVMLRQEVHDLQHRLIQAESQFRDAQGLDAQFRMMFIELLRKVETVQRTLHAPNTFDEYIDLAREDQSSTSSSLGDLEDEEGSESD